MSEYQQRANSGVLFKNNRKESDTHPDYTGTATIRIGENVQNFFMDAWIKESKKNGKKFMSFSFKPKGQRRSSEPAEPRQPTHRPLPPPPTEEDSDCPW